MALKRCQQDGLIPGFIVRYNETGSRWFIAVVHRVLAKDIELEYLDGGREPVPIEKVESFLSHLRSRDRVLSLTRQNLCYALYGEAITRLRQDRADQMRHFLRSHGLRFQPTDWTANTRIQIWPDDSHVKAGPSMADRALEALLPKWLEPHRLPAGSRDPLGFQNHAERLANEFLPGLTVFTTRIAYYGFIAWAVQELNQQTWPSGTVLRELFHKLERAYVLCEFIHHGNDAGDCRVIGQRSKSEVLQTAINDRFRTPTRIMKNQEAAGSLRLYATSMESMGFAELRPERVADGLLPILLTDLGKRLAREFEKHLPDGFFYFALSDGTKSRDREVLRSWGKQLCMSTYGRLRYRTPFLEGFLLGNSEAAEARYRTITLLLKRRLLQEDYNPRPGKRRETLPEDAANVAEDEPGAEGLTNAAVLLDFYDEVPHREIAVLQKAAVYEILCLAQSSIFASVIDALDKSGRCQVSSLRDSIVATKRFGKFWLTPFGETARLPTVRELHDTLFEVETFVEMAAIGGVMLRRLQNDAAFQASAPELQGMPPLALMQGIPTEKSLTESFVSLIESMVIRHEQVSFNKNRQRWCYFDESGQQLVKGDVRPLGVGWHSMRFPQLYALCKDVRPTKDDVSYAK
jgi:hypothetical protein